MFSNILKNVKIADYTSWLVGGNAEYFCLPTTREELVEALKFAKAENLKKTILGGGSNVLVSDDGIKGFTICLRKFSQIESAIENDRLKISCWSGTAKSELLKTFLKHQLPPALFLAGLPGDVGGGVVMNAGVAEMFTPREFMDFVDEIEVIDENGKFNWLKKSELKISYRHTDGWQPHIVTAAKISWPYERDAQILDQVREANKIRLSKQPLDMPSCGSVFKNPEGHKAAQLIDDCGLKGFKIGEAQVSLKHANFIVNLGEAKATDIWKLIQHVQKTVLDLRGVALTTEVVRLGEW